MTTAAQKAAQRAAAEADATPPPVVDPLAQFRQDPEPVAVTQVDDPAPAITFDVAEDDPDPLASIVRQAVGAASMAWENVEGAGVFHDRQANDVADSLLFVLRTTQGLIGPDQQAEAAAVMEAAWHQDTVALGFLHNGGVCGCRYIATLAVRAAMPSVVVG